MGSSTALAAGGFTRAPGARPRQTAPPRVKSAPVNYDIERWTWVIVGDLPPACVPAAVARNGPQALNRYAGAMLEWVEAIEAGQPVEGLQPVNAPPTPEWAARLRKRLQFLAEHSLRPNARLLEAPTYSDEVESDDR